MQSNLLKSHFSMGVLLQICCIISEHLFLTTLDGCLRSLLISIKTFVSRSDIFDFHLWYSNFMEKCFMFSSFERFMSWFSFQVHMENMPLLNLCQWQTFKKRINKFSFKMVHKLFPRHILWYVESFYSWRKSYLVSKSIL